MDKDLREAFDDIRRRIDASAAETRRHFEVAAEDLRGHVRQVAEGVGALSERIDRLEANVRDDIARCQRELSALIHFSHAELERKIQTLEVRVGDLEARLVRLEAGR